MNNKEIEIGEAIDLVISNHIKNRKFKNRDREELTQELWKKALEAVKLRGLLRKKELTANERFRKLYVALNHHLADILKSYDQLLIAEKERDHTDIEDLLLPDHDIFGSVQEDYVIGVELLQLIADWASKEDKRTQIFISESLVPSLSTLKKWREMSRKDFRPNTVAKILNINHWKQMKILEDLRRFLKRNGFEIYERRKVNVHSIFDRDNSSY